MLTPSEALTTAAQIAVALAGFAGVAAAFGTGALHSWSQADRLRLRLLLATGLLPLAWCLLALLLMTTPLPEALIWRICSVASGASLLAGLALNIPSASSLAPGSINRGLFFSSGVGGLIVAAMQAGNALLWGLFWPFFTIVMSSMLICIVQFARLILLIRT